MSGMTRRRLLRGALPLAAAAVAPSGTPQPLLEAGHMEAPGPGRFRLLFEDRFQTLSLRTGGPTDDGLRVGKGTWTPRYQFDANPKGHTFDDGEEGWILDPGYAWSGQYSPTGQVSLREPGILRIRGEPTPISLAGKIPINPRRQTPYSWVTGTLTTRHSAYFCAPAFMEARMRVPRGRGTWSAFWAYSQHPGPHREIDVMEVLGHQPDWLSVAQHVSLAPGHPLVSDKRYADCGKDLSAGFHTYGCFWTRDTTTFFLDGVPVRRTRTHTLLRNAELYLILTLAIGGDWPGLPDESTPRPSDLLVEYVRVWGGATTRAHVDPPPPASLSVSWHPGFEGGLVPAGLPPKTVIAELGGASRFELAEGRGTVGIDGTALVLSAGYGRGRTGRRHVLIRGFGPTGIPAYGAPFEITLT